MPAKSGAPGRAVRRGRGRRRRRCGRWSTSSRRWRCRRSGPSGRSSSRRRRGRPGRPTGRRGESRELEGDRATVRPVAVLVVDEHEAETVRAVVEEQDARLGSLQFDESGGAPVVVGEPPLVELLDGLGARERRQRNAPVPCSRTNCPSTAALVREASPRPAAATPTLPRNERRVVRASRRRFGGMAA